MTTMFLIRVQQELKESLLAIRSNAKNAEIVRQSFAGKV